MTLGSAGSQTMQLYITFGDRVRHFRCSPAQGRLERIDSGFETGV